MENKIWVFNMLLILIYGIFIFTINPTITIIYGTLLIFWIVLNLPYFQNKKFVKKIFDGLYKLSFPYTTDEVIILNCMKIVNFFIGKRFQFLFWIKKQKDKPLIITDKTIFYDDFKFLNKDNWDIVFPWGDSYNVDHNVYIKDQQLYIKTQVENHRGWWDKWWDFKVTAGLIYSKKTFPVNATYEARVKFSNVDYINQAFWLLRFKDEPLPKIIEESDFEYHLSKDRITMSQHWGNGYRHDQLHRQDSFNFKINLSKNWHVLKFVIKKNRMSWYIDDVLVKWHFIGIPELEQHIVFGTGYGDKAEDPTDIGKLDLNKLPAYFKCDWIKIDKN